MTMLPRLLDADRKPIEVFCRDGEAETKGFLVLRGGGSILFEADLEGAGAGAAPVQPGRGARGELLDANRDPFNVFRSYDGALDEGVLVVRPGGVILFQPVINRPIPVAESEAEDVRAARREASAEGVDPREVAPAST